MGRVPHLHMQVTPRFPPSNAIPCTGQAMLRWSDQPPFRTAVQEGEPFFRSEGHVTLSFHPSSRGCCKRRPGASPGEVHNGCTEPSQPSSDPCYSLGYPGPREPQGLHPTTEGLQSPQRIGRSSDTCPILCEVWSRTEKPWIDPRVSFVFSHTLRYPPPASFQKGIDPGLSAHLNPNRVPSIFLSKFERTRPASEPPSETRLGLRRRM